MGVHKRRCTDCHRVYHILETARHGPSALDREDDDIDNLSCPSCDSTAYLPLIGSATGVDLGGEAGATSVYPRFDQGLGCIVKSRTHLRFLMDHNEDGTPRAIPLRPTEGEDPTGEFYEKQWAEEDRRKAQAAKDNEQFQYENRADIAHMNRVVAEEQRKMKRGERSIFLSDDDRRRMEQETAKAKLEHERRLEEMARFYRDHGYDIDFRS
jgi:hypothetical protein